MKTDAFAAINTSVDRPYIAVWTVKGSARQVREEVGKAFNEDCPAAGWIEARDKHGYRVRRINMTCQA
jgi:hypothetical protein